MEIPQNYYEMILKEFKEIDKSCSEVKSLHDKLYYFSASFGIINRIMNFYCDPTLIFMHQILQTVHQAFSLRLDATAGQTTISKSFPDQMWESFFRNFSELILAFEKKDEGKIREVLEKFSNLWYATTGNGFYLFLQRKLKI